MSLTLSLLRHAKSSWTAPAQGDFDRPLADRGRSAAPAIGRYMRTAGIRPGLVICSPARRTRETLALVMKAAEFAPVTRFEDRVYLAASSVLLALLQRLGASSDPDGTDAGGTPSHVMLIGHNPGLHDLALELVGAGPDDLRRDLAGKLPTAALVIIELAAEDWTGVSRGCGTLRSFTIPKRLAA